MADFQFLRVTPVNLMRYLPQFLAKDKRFKIIQSVLSDEHEKQRISGNDVTKQFFVSTATWGLDDWEDFLGIDTNRKLDYQTRRAAIIARINNNTVITLDYVNYLINLFVADKSGIAEDHPEEYLLEIWLPDGKVTNFNELEKTLDVFIPAHIGWKYIAYVHPSTGQEIEVDGVKTTATPLYIGGTMSSYWHTDIPADTSYEIGDIEAAESMTIGVVKEVQVLNIPADYHI